eukprot:CAMPEP_0198514460 /NCGR_PEP_ID=MMETSP1462-20131121/16702_1 /TAXON_ID=1333877 /ORGANISM="Brandtodinium nutriculum, Strain RCC3387" /LENGTH=197 /DNA_ID=CAMNT_0044243921 /DNA_START=23 /DNA_END=612 /DNA_ORIENTATION=+
MDDARVLHGLVQHGERVVQGALGLVEDVRRGAPEDDGTSLVLRAARKLDHFVLSDHHLRNPLAIPQLGFLRVLERRSDVGTQDGGQPLRAVEVGMLDCHHAAGLEKLLWVVVNELPINEHIAAMLDDPLDLHLHLVLLRLLDLRHCLEGVNLHPSSVNLDFVGVHLAVRHQDLAILKDLRHSNADLLLQDEALLEEG